MLQKLYPICSILSIMTGVFMLTRYVFLEQGMEEKKQRSFYIVSYCAVLLFYFTVDIFALDSNGNYTQALFFLFGMLNIALGRKKHRLLGSLMFIPLAGLMNGIGAPILFVQIDAMFANNGKVGTSAEVLGEMVIYILMAVFLLVFYFKGKEWRRWFRENMQNRKPLVSEYVVLCVSGTLLFIGNSVVTNVAYNLVEEFAELTGIVGSLVFCYEIIAFFLSITVVVLIMQGNRRKFYQDRVANMQFNVISTMADIVENRDSNTGGHIKRTAKYVEIIGRNLKKQNAFPEVLTDEYLADMIVAAPLHDIGKISIPDAILNKPGKLTDEEFAVMKTHAAAGRDVLLKAEGQLGEFNYLEVALDMAEYHHEWWNGKGYPNGISGEEIPLCARVMAVADVFDALTSKRCYKEAMPLEKAYNIIREETGTHFDPIVAETFLNSRQEIEAAIKELSLDEP